MSAQESKYLGEYFKAVGTVMDQIPGEEVDKTVDILAKVKAAQGRLVILGVGGSAGSASHAVNDFRKLAGIEAYAPTDNVSELTARTNDEGWDTVFEKWLRTSHLRDTDAVMVLSVGGGNLENNVSPNIVRALQHAQNVSAKILGIVSRDGGYTKQVADACILIPTFSPETITPIAESLQAVIWHGIVNHPLLKEP